HGSLHDERRGAGSLEEVEKTPMKNIKRFTARLTRKFITLLGTVPNTPVFAAMMLAATIFVPFAAADEGEDLYQKQNWRGAFEFYKSRIDADQGGWEDCYNAGNCLFRMGKYPEARLYYLRAKKLSPRSRDINYNLQVLGEKLSLPDVPQSALASLGDLFTEDEFRTAVVVVTWLFFFAAMLHVFTKSELSLWLAAALFVTGAFAWGALYAKMNGGPTGGYGIVMREEGMQSGPGASYKVIASVPAGMKAAIYDEEEGWLFVRVAASSGWIRKSALEKI
ncbi:MAG: tetratricopeptide repeat protein, partial [Candidatus Omnitrophota bacterium]